MPILEINAQALTPLVEQIVVGIEQKIDQQQLRHGRRLPSIRQFAAEHGVSRFTVVQAYDRLVASGYLQSRKGSGFYVNKPQAEVLKRVELGCDLNQAVDELWILRRYLQEEPRRYQPGMGWLPADWLDGALVQRSMRQLAKLPPASMVQYGRGAGYRPLRLTLQRRLEEQGIQAEPEQIITTHGVTHALDLIGRYLVRPGDLVLVDDPAYFNLFGGLKSLGAKLIGIPRNADGPDVAFMKHVLSGNQAKLFVTSSLLHNPTSSSVTPAVAYQLLKLAEQHDFLIVDDDIYGDFHADANCRLAALDQLNRVIQVSSFSKTISGAMRVGYIACHHQLAEELLNLKLLTSFSSSELNERIVHDILSSGMYRKHLNRINRQLAQAREQCLQKLETLAFTPFVEPEHGFFIWAKLPDGVVNAAELASLALQRNMMLAPGNIFSPSPTISRYLRFNAAYAKQGGVFAVLDKLLESSSCR